MLGCLRRPYVGDGREAQRNLADEADHPSRGSSPARGLMPWLSVGTSGYSSRAR